MLIFTRTPSATNDGNTFRIGDDITVTVLAVRGNQVRLGINAPKDTPVHREEVYQRIAAEKAESTEGATS